MSQTTDVLDINNVGAIINQKYSLFNNNTGSDPGFEVPINSGKHSIFASSFWISGIDGGGLLNGAFQTYNELDFRGGVSAKFQRVWKIDLTTIHDHQTNYANSGYVMPYVIEFWPAHGDTTLGEDFYMAPFYDVNSNGVYEPTLGDYPKIKGDQAIWWFMSDDTTHASFSQRMGIDIHCMAYAFDCGDSAVDNSVFIDYKIINQSTSTYQDVWIGKYIDFDIGNSQDDFIGTSVRDGVFYSYNANSFDGGASGYGNHPPAQGCMILGPHQDPDGEDNPGPNFSNNYHVPVDTALMHNGVVYRGQGINYGDGIIDNERLGLTRTMGVSSGSSFPTSEPVSPAGYYYFLKGIWQDGTTLSHGGDGYPAANPVNSKFMYPDTSDLQFWSTDGDTVPTWSEITALHSAGDRRMMGSTGPFTMTPGYEDSVTFIYVFGRDYASSDPLESVNIMLERARTIRSYLDNCCIPCSKSLSTNEIIKPDNVLVYPNPSADKFTITSATLPDRINVYNNIGQLVLTTTSTSVSTELDLTNLGSGVFYATIEFKDNSITKTLIKTE